MGQESGHQVRAALDPPQPGDRTTTVISAKARAASLANAICADAPRPLRRVQLGRVGGRVVRLQPPARGDGPPHPAAAVPGQVLPVVVSAIRMRRASRHRTT